MRRLITILFALLFSFPVFAGSFGPFDFNQQDPFVKEYKVYPNPTTGKLSVHIESLNENDQLTVRVYSIIGQEMKKIQLAPFNGNMDVSMDMSKYPKGIYMIELSNGTQTRTKRISVI